MGATSSHAVNTAGLFEDGLPSKVRILIVDDYEPWRRFLRTSLQTESEFEVIAEAADGLEAVQKAQALQPDIVLLDIGLPRVSGIEVARQICCGPLNLNVVFVSQERSPHIVKHALAAGAQGYLVKSDAASELMAALKVVIRGKRFVSSSVAGYDLGSDDLSQRQRYQGIAVLPRQSAGIAPYHEAGFYPDDKCLLDDLTQFIGSALISGDAAIVVATESHREALFPGLQGHGVDVGAAIDQGRYLALDAAGSLSVVMVNSLPDPVRFLELWDNLLGKVGKCAGGRHSRIAVFGECVDLLLAEGRADAAIQIERLGNHLGKRHNAHILCGYFLRTFQGGMGSHIFESICAEHSAVHFR